MILSNIELRQPELPFNNDTTAHIQQFSPTCPKPNVSGCMVDKNEAPNGFYAVAKKDIQASNVCNVCDAKKLCQVNENDWCLKNRCMSYGIISFKDGKTYKRNDGQSVIFKCINTDK